MKKKCFLLFSYLFFLCNIQVFGQGSATASHSLLMYRIGAGIAAEYASIEGHLKNRPLNPEDDANPANENFASDAHHSCRKFQVSPGVELGVFIAKDYYLGLAVSYHNTNAQNVMYTSIGQAIHFEHELKLKSYTDLFLKFGYKIMPKIMFYGLLGPSFANWSHNSKTIYYNTTLKRKSVEALSQMNKKTTGLGVGTGVEYFINDKYSINLNYTINMHKAKKLRYLSSYNTDTWDTVYTDVQKSVRLTYSTIGVRFSYFFSF